MKAKDIQFSILKVRDTYFYINENLNMPDRLGEITVGINPTLGFKREENLVVLTINVVFLYGEMEYLPENILLSTTTQNIFEIPALNDFFNDGDILVLPRELITTLLSLSISHSRALALKNSAGSTYEKVVIPVINAAEAARTFFPYMFEGDTSNVVVDKVDSK